MSTTSLKLPPELRERITAVAEEAGLTAHAFMVAAVEQATSAAEKRSVFVADAVKARAEYQYNGEFHAAADVQAYFADRVAGKQVKRPRLKTCRR